MKSSNYLVGLLIAVLQVACGCHTARRIEIWVIPAGYVGWVRLDYGVQGAAALPLAGGKVQIRMPVTGRLFTSSFYEVSVDDNEYYVQDGLGLRRLAVLPQGPEYAIQKHIVFATMTRDNSPGGGGRYTAHDKFQCVYVGTQLESRADARDCRAWKVGEAQPPQVGEPKEFGERP